MLGLQGTLLEVHDRKQTPQGLTIDRLGHEVSRIAGPRDLGHAQPSLSQRVLYPEGLRVEVSNTPEALPLGNADGRAGVDVDMKANMDTKVAGHRLKAQSFRRSRHHGV